MKCIVPTIYQIKLSKPRRAVSGSKPKMCSLHLVAGIIWVAMIMEHVSHDYHAQWMINQSQHQTHKYM